MEPQSDWTPQEFISWGKYIIAAIECDWEEDLEEAITQFTDKYGRRDSREYGEIDGYDYEGRADDFEIVEPGLHTLEVTP